MEKTKIGLISDGNRPFFVRVVENEKNTKLHQTGGEIGIAFPSVFAYVPWRLSWRHSLPVFLLELGTGFAYLGRQKQIVGAWE